MSWTRLENPRPPSDRSAPPDGVRLSPRMAGGRHGKARVPWIRVQIGKHAARRGSFNRAEHKVHVLVGGGDERGSMAIVCDDESGKFKAKQQRDGSYVVPIPKDAAAGRFSTAFEPFTVAEAKAIPNGQGPAFITFAVPKAFLAAGGGR
jgi:hypothetical protein